MATNTARTALDTKHAQTQTHTAHYSTQTQGREVHIAEHRAGMRASPSRQTDRQTDRQTHKARLRTHVPREMKEARSTFYPPNKRAQHSTTHDKKWKHDRPPSTLLLFLARRQTTQPGVSKSRWRRPNSPRPGRSGDWPRSFNPFRTAVRAAAPFWEQDT